jgi:thiol:disulfide interchange protein
VLGRALAYALVPVGIYFLFGPFVLKADGPIVPPEKLFESKIAWRDDHDQALEDAKAAGKPVIVDFTARWCNACHELELTAFREDEIVREARRFVAVRVDVTTDEHNQKLKTEVYKAFSIPFLAFYDSRGKLAATLPRAGSRGITDEDILTTLKEVR